MVVRRQHMRFGDNAEFGAGLFLAADIHFGRRILAHAHKRQSGNHPARFERRHARGEFALDLRGDGPPVNEIVHNELLSPRP